MRWEERLSECEGFQWDTGDSTKIWEQHGVAPMECEELFFNQPLIVGEDEKHSEHEDHFYALGQTDAGRWLLVVFSLGGRRIRVLSARDMSRKERKLYQES